MPWFDDTNPFKTVFLDYYPQPLVEETIGENEDLQSLVKETMGENEDLRFGDELLQKYIEALKLLVKNQSD